jgi:carbonic anhydrase
MLSVSRLKNLLLLCLITTLVIAIPVAAQAPPASEAHSWSYSGEHGPEHWGSQFATCGIGNDQSPIDIVNAKKEKLPEIRFSYHPSQLKVVNNGHTIQVNYRAGSAIVRDGKEYELVQFHFHHISENAINLTHAPMELHLVHRAEDGSLAVVAVMLKEGHPNKVVDLVWSRLPAAEDIENAPPSVKVNAAGLLPGMHNYYTFPGSLTTPPCSENVLWLVLEKPMTLSKEQIAKFAAIYPNNARPVQPLNGRALLESK